MMLTTGKGVGRPGKVRSCTAKAIRLRKIVLDSSFNNHTKAETAGKGSGSDGNDRFLRRYISIHFNICVTRVKEMFFV